MNPSPVEDLLTIKTHTSITYLYFPKCVLYTRSVSISDPPGDLIFER